MMSNNLLRHPLIQQGILRPVDGARLLGEVVASLTDPRRPREIRTVKRLVGNRKVPCRICESQEQAEKRWSNGRKVGA